MKPRRVSAQDVARRAGVSRTTVSFVLNNSPGKSITEETRRRVLHAAGELGYMPNEDARRLALVRSSAIGVFITHSQYVYSDVFISRVIEGMSQAVNRNRVQLVIHPLRFEEHGYLRLVEEAGVQGVILINTRENDPGIAELSRHGVPTVSIDFMEDSRVDQVYVDNRGAAREIVKLVLDWGHRDVAMITHAPLEFSASRRRFEGYCDALAEYGINPDEAWIRYGSFTEDSGYKAMSELLRDGLRPTAVFAGNDMIAYGALMASRDNGVVVPDDISVVGFDDDYLSRYTNPPLTTMALPAAGLGSEAVNLLIRRIQAGRAGSSPITTESGAGAATESGAGGGAADTTESKETSSPQRIVLPTHISIRGSCRRIHELPEQN